MIDAFRPGSSSSDPPEVALGRAGATAVWLRNVQFTGPTGTRSSVAVVRTASAPTGAAFGQPVTLSGDPPASGSSPRVVTDESGTPTVVLVLQAPSLGARIASGPPLAFEQLVPLSHPAVSSVGSVRLSAGPRGDALAVWSMSDGVAPRLQAAYRPAGGGFGPSVTVTPGRDASSPPALDMAVSESGRAAMIYTLGFDRFVHWIAPSGHYGRRLKISGDRPSQVRFDPSGNLVGLFTSHRGAVKYGVMRPHRRRFAHPEVLARGGSLLVLGQGSETRSRLIAAWVRDNGTYQVSVASPEGRFGPATALFDPVPTSAGCQSSTATAPVVSSNARGDAVIAWCGVNGVMAAVQPAGEPFRTPQHVSRGDRPGTARPPAVAMDAEGNVLAVWTTPDGIKGAWYTPPPR